MECHACQVQNILGAARCGRCGASLSVTLPGDVQRPREPDAPTAIHPRPWELEGPRAWEPETQRSWQPETPRSREPETPRSWEPETPRSWEPEPEPTQVRPDSLMPGMQTGEPWRYDPNTPQAVLPAPRPWRPPPIVRRRRSKRTNQALIGAAIIVVVATGSAVTLAFGSQGNKSQNALIPQGGTSSATDSAASGDAAKSQATVIDALLDSMASTRAELIGAVATAGGCPDLDTAVPALRKVLSERSTELDRATSLQVSALAGGDKLKAALNRALQASMDADNHFLSWAQNNQGCSGRTPHDADFTRAGTISTKIAGPAKTEFLRYWTPIARQQGLNPRTKGHI